MKLIPMNSYTPYTLRSGFTLGALASLLYFSSCSDDDPKKEDAPELITRLGLTFTPTDHAEPIIFSAVDPDGEGVQDLQVEGPISLDADRTYVLTINLLNELADPSDEAYNITEEVEEEGDEHMFFFSWTNNVFGDPSGNGNIDSRADDVNYEDTDVNGLPVGIETIWTTGDVSSGKFRIVLKHQPGLKTTSSLSSTGETDLDVEFDIEIE